MQIPPESVILQWPKPNYIDPVTRGNENVILNVVLYTCLMLFLGLRLFTRTCLKNIFGADDILILLAALPTTVFFIISVLADVQFLWIRHVYDIPTNHVTLGLKMVLAAEVCFASACTLMKLSMLMLLRRLLANSTLFWRRITILAMFVVGIQGTVFCLTVLFQCRPPQDYWTVTIDPQPNCINQSSSLLVAGIINTLTDFIVVLLPIRTVLALQLPSRDAFVVVLLFAFGFFGCAAGVARTYYMYMVTQTYDQTWASYPVWMTSAIELYIGVLCASIPATKPFFSTYLPQVFGSITSMSSLSRTRVQTQNNQSSTPSEFQDSELVDFQKMLQSGARHSESTAVSTAAVSRLGSKSESEDFGHIQVTQTVEQVSGKT